MVIEGLFHITIQTEKMIDSCNKNKKDLDWVDLEDKIDKVVIEANFSTKKIDSMKAKQGKQQRKGKNTSLVIIQIRNHTLKSKLR